MIAACPATLVQPASLPGAPSGVPWFRASAKLAGIAFGVPPGATALELPVDGVWPDGRNAKILWWPRTHGAGATLTIRSGAYRLTVHASGGNFPSIVSLPHEGCWRLDVRTGKLHGVVWVRAVTP
jgi:hypothetical protein